MHDEGDLNDTASLTCQWMLFVGQIYYIIYFIRSIGVSLFYCPIKQTPNHACNSLYSVMHIMIFSS